MRAKTISINNDNVYLGESIVISADAGEDVESYAVTYKVGSTTTATSLGQFTFTESLFEPLFPTSTYLDVTFICTSTFFDKTSQATQVTCRVNITDKYAPTLNIIGGEPEHSHNNYIMAGTYTIEFAIENPGHSNTTLTARAVSDKPVTYVASTNTKYVFNLPEPYDVYKVHFVFTLTDSRGFSNEYVTEDIDVYSYAPAKIFIKEAYRADEEGLDTLNGTYATIRVVIEDTASTIDRGYVKINGVSYLFTTAEAELIVGDGNLDISSDYEYEVGYTSAIMKQQGFSALVVTNKLEAQKVPISLLDDGGTRGVSLCEMIKPYDDTFSNSIINYSGESDMRVKKGDKLAVETSFNVVDGRRYITEDVLDNLKFRAMSKTDYINLKNKDFNTVYFVY